MRLAIVAALPFCVGCSSVAGWFDGRDAAELQTTLERVIDDNQELRDALADNTEENASLQQAIKRERERIDGTDAALGAAASIAVAAAGVYAKKLIGQSPTS